MIDCCRDTFYPTVKVKIISHLFLFPSDFSAMVNETNTLVHHRRADKEFAQESGVGIMTPFNLKLPPPALARKPASTLTYQVLGTLFMTEHSHYSSD